MRGLTAFLLALVSACGSRPPDPPATATAPPQTPQLAVAAPQSPQPAASHGQQLFAQHCAICHASGKLYPGYAALLQAGRQEPDLSRRQDLPAAYIRLVVRQGLGPMLPFNSLQLPDGELEQIVEYLGGKP